MSSSSSAAVARVMERPGVSTPRELFHSSGGRSVVWCLVLIAVVLVSYNPVNRNSFVNYDDEGYIVQKSQVQTGLTWATLKWAFTTYDASNWHPLTWIFYAFDYQLFGLNPAGHHYMNVLLHAADAVILFLLLQSATGFRWRSLMVAALFALHPINVESVAWASELKNVLSMFFFLLALYAYGWYARRPALGPYAGVAVSFALALMAKPQVVTFPFLLLLWDYWPLRRIGASSPNEPAPQVAPMPKASVQFLILEKLPLLALAALSSLLTIKAQKAAGTVKALSLYSLPLRLETAVIAYVRYLGKAFWPSKLVVLYPHPTRLYPVWQMAAGVALLTLISALVFRARDRRYLAVGWLWFLGSLVPMIGLVQVGAQAMADRYAYLPFIGLFLMETWLVADLTLESAKHRNENHRVPAVSLAIPAVACLLALGTLTYHQVSYWHDTETLWHHTLALTEDNFFAHDILGYYLTTQGRTEEGADQFRAALAIRPEDPEANMNLGPYEQARGNLAAAIDHYQRVALYSANAGLRATAYFNLGHAYRQMGDLGRARQCFEITLQMAPDEPTAMIGLGLIAEANGDLAEAVRQYSHARAVHPSDLASILLAHALQREGHADEAKEILDRAARSSPDFPEAQQMAVLLLSGK